MAEIKSRIRVKRCTNTSLSSHNNDTLPAGAPLYNTDTNELFVGENDRLEDKRAVTSGELRYKDVRIIPTISSSGKNRVDIMGDSEINIEGENMSSLLIRHISPSSSDGNSGLEITTDNAVASTSAGGINIGIGATTAQTNCITIGTKIGQNSPDSKNSSIAIGSGKTQAIGNNSIAIGNGITADKDNQVVLGNYDFSKIFETSTNACKKATILYPMGSIRIQSLPCTITQTDVGEYTYVEHTKLDEWTESTSVSDSYKAFEGTAVPLFQSGNNVEYLVTLQTKFGIKSLNKQLYIEISNSSLKQALNVPSNKIVSVSFASVSRLVGENEYNIKETDSTTIGQSFASAITSTSDVICSNGHLCGVFQLLMFCTVA